MIEMRFDADDITTQTPTTSIDDVPLQIVNAKNEMTIHNPLQSPIPLLFMTSSISFHALHIPLADDHVSYAFNFNGCCLLMSY